MTSSSIVRSQVLKPADMALTSNPIRDQHFEDCIIQGPAVITFLGETELNGCGFEGNTESILWEIDAERTSVLGAVGFENCVFTRCQFRAVGVAGNREFLNSFTQMFMNVEDKK